MPTRIIINIDLKIPASTIDTLILEVLNSRGALYSVFWAHALLNRAVAFLVFYQVSDTLESAHNLLSLCTFSCYFEKYNKVGVAYSFWINCDIIDPSLFGIYTFSLLYPNYRLIDYHSNILSGVTEHLSSMIPAPTFDIAVCSEQCHCWSLFLSLK